MSAWDLEGQEGYFSKDYQVITFDYRGQGASRMMTFINIRDKSRETAEPLTPTCGSELYSLTGL
jgi:hypothetical protein